MSIDKLLIANRGEIARRIVRTCRAMGISTVAVCSDPDLASPVASEADEVVRLPGRTPAETYLVIGRIVDAALRTGAQAVHPGYGFLAENAELARACVDAGLVFVGPPPEAIERMASKLESKAIMESVGVPVLSGVDVTGLDRDAVGAAAQRVGWPVLVKASAGGGGRGIRIVRGADELPDAVASAAREAEAAFGDATLLVEHFVERARHVEVQVIADTLGTTAHLFERECSVQRRYQKVIEESPSPAVDDSLRDALGRAAIAAAQAVGYRGAGTVEFLLAPDDVFFFMEMNTRLQVEHPVTEAVTGLDLVRLQILVAEGTPLPEQVLRARQNGHAIEARLYAEDPARDYAPVTGTCTEFAFTDRPGLRVDSAVTAGTELSSFYDAMLAKVIAWAPTRAEAIRLLRAALRDARIHGIETNRFLLGAVLADPRFLAGAVDTEFLDHFDATDARWDDSHRRALYAGAAAVAAASRRRSRADVLATIPATWRNGTDMTTHSTLDRGADVIEVVYALDAGRFVRVDELEAAIVSASEHEVVLEHECVRRRFAVRHDDGALSVDGPFGSESFRERSRFPTVRTEAVAGSLTAPMPGMVVRVLVELGAVVDPGAPLLVVEAMKMEHTIATPEAGTVTELRVGVGVQVEAGEILAVVTAAEGGSE